MILREVSKTALSIIKFVSDDMIALFIILLDSKIL